MRANVSRRESSEWRDTSRSISPFLSAEDKHRSISDHSLSVVIRSKDSPQLLRTHNRWQRTPLTRLLWNAPTFWGNPLVEKRVESVASVAKNSHFDFWKLDSLNCRPIGKESHWPDAGYYAPVFRPYSGGDNRFCWRSNWVRSSSESSKPTSRNRADHRFHSSRTEEPLDSLIVDNQSAFNTCLSLGQIDCRCEWRLKSVIGLQFVGQF